MEIKIVKNMPIIKIGDNVSEILIKSIESNKIKLEDKDIICVASKIISISENRIVSLNNYKVSKDAQKIHKIIPRKDERIIEAIIQNTPGGLDRIVYSKSHIGAWSREGLFLTSGGIDRYDKERIVLLPSNPDESAKKIGQDLFKKYKKNIAVLITDSDGRVDKMGATQVAIGLYGINPLRNRMVYDKYLKCNKNTSETICDMLAAAAGLLMGQRGQNKPVVIIRGFDYDFNKKHVIREALYNYFDKENSNEN